MNRLFGIAAALFVVASWTGIAPANGQEPPTGDFYGGYSLIVKSDRGTDFGLDIDHVRGMETGDAFLSIYWTATGMNCPPGFDPAFCDELSRTVPKPGGSGTVPEPETLGVLIEDNEAFIAFRIGAQGVPHLLVLHRMGPEVTARIYNRDRGVVADAKVAERSHLCEQSMCMAGRFQRLAENPKAALGVFSEKQAFLAQFNRADGRKAQTPPVDRLSFITGEWEMVAEEGESLGTIGLVLKDDRITGNGTVMERIVQGQPLDVTLYDVGVTDDGVHFRVTFDGGSEGGESFVPLLLTLPKEQGGTMRGSMRQGERFELVSLRFVAPYQGGQAPPTEPAAEPDVVLQPDTSSPAGVAAFSYDLAGVPDGKRLTLRAQPSPQGTRTGALPSGKRGLLVLACHPAIDDAAYEKADRAVQIALLSSRWCEVRDAEGHQQGFVKGRYLTPVVN